MYIFICPPRPGICKENIGNDNITNIKWYQYHTRKATVVFKYINWDIFIIRFRYHNDTHKCYHIDERGPCGKLMLFYGIGDTDYGECDCNLYYRCARPIIYWAPAKRCYLTFIFYFNIYWYILLLHNISCYYTNDQVWLIMDEQTQATH